MKREENHKDDLEYLAALGFSKVATDASDLKDLEKRIRTRSFSGNSMYLMLGSLGVGVLIGFAVFFGISKKEDRLALNTKNERSDHKTIDNPVIPQKVIPLDTVSVHSENFIKPSRAKTPVANPEQHTISMQDSVDLIVSKQVDLSLLSKADLKEEKLKFMINSPVFYLHDMKITNYTTLYFKNNKYVKFSGMSADYSPDNHTVPNGSNLKQSADYYLHEELADGMLQFKRGKYDEALYTLRSVSTYNKNDLNCDFYMAMCYYYKKNFPKAVALFDDCISNANNTFLQESMFYKALALWESGSKEEAKKLFGRIAEEGEFYAVKARSYIKE